MTNIRKTFFTAFVGFLLALNLMAAPALASGIEVELSGDRGAFPVVASDEDGTTVYNSDLGYVGYAQYYFEGNNEWQAGPANPVTGACGAPGWSTQGSMTYPQFDAFSLDAESSFGPEYEACRTPVLPLREEETLTFKINDAPGTYDDNEGVIFVTYERL